VTKLEAIIETKRLVAAGRLEAEQSFVDAGIDTLLDSVNGCGRAGAKFDFVPDSLWGLNIIFACIIHDWDYKIGKTKRDKRLADIRFLVNMVLIILDNSGWFFKVLRVERAVKYFLAVDLKGGKAFWRGKK